MTFLQVIHYHFLDIVPLHAITPLQQTIEYTYWRNYYELEQTFNDAFYNDECVYRV